MLLFPRSCRLSCDSADVSVYATGGTILSRSDYSRLDGLAYGDGDQLTAHDLLKATDEVLDIAQVAIVDFSPTAGLNLKQDYILNITKHFKAHGCGSDVAGGVMLRGTSTLHETVSPPIPR